MTTQQAAAGQTQISFGDDNTTGGGGTDADLLRDHKQSERSDVLYELGDIL
jgi:hypothetical protein